MKEKYRETKKKRLGGIRISRNSGLPPGVTVAAIEKAMRGCEDCEYEECPWGRRFEFCPRVEIIEKCGECGKRIGLVPALVKHKVFGYEPIYLCSLRCKRKMQPKVSKEIQEAISFSEKVV